MIYAIIIFIVILLGFCLYWLVVFNEGKKVLIDTFSNDNVIVFGAKGKGKDLIFNKTINARNRPYYANIPYNKLLGVVKDLSELSVAPNTFQNIMDGNIVQIQKTLNEETDYYISDAGNYLPAQYSAQLVKKYPSLPTFYSLSRHLYKMNIHANTQDLTRIWNLLREQADKFIKAEKTVCVFGIFLITTYIYYDRYESAASEIRPFKQRLLNKEQKALKSDFEAKHGVVKRFRIMQLTKHVYYDTRAFHKIIFGYNSPDTI